MVADALKAEFGFMGGHPDSWRKAAAGIIRKLEVEGATIRVRTRRRRWWFR